MRWNYQAPDRRKRKRRRRKNTGRSPEDGWGGKQRTSRLYRILANWTMLLGGVGVAVLTLLKWGEHYEQRPPIPVEVGTGKDVAGDIDAAEAVARAFLAETDPMKRLQWVRDAGEIRGHLDAYPAAVRTEPGKIEQLLGHGMMSGHGVTGFVVALPSGELRLLEVVHDDEAVPRVDWDAYARHGTASWEDLWRGKAQQAIVRVFAQPGIEHPEPFADTRAWTCFQLGSSDMPHMALGFARVGSVRERRMREAILSTDKYRQRFILEVRRHKNASKPHFEIMRCLAIGWVRGEQDIEDVWTGGESD